MKIAYKNIDLVLVPGIVFDKEGHRIGYGFGYYDKFLKKVPKAIKLGLTFDFQVIDKIPREMHDLAEFALKGNFEEARNIHYKLLPLFKGIFIETNPIPIKSALAMKGMIKEAYRLPLCEMKPENKEKLRQVLKDLKII